MNDLTSTPHRNREQQWLVTYYLARATFSIAWIGAALSLARESWHFQAALLVLYPVWDALANLVDGARSGGLARNRTQAVNVAVSLAIAGAVAAFLGDMHKVLGVFGAWAILSGLLQFGTAWRRRKAHGAQWAMILSGAQSALAGVFMIFQAQMPAAPSISAVTGYAGFGAFYFLVSGVMLGVRQSRAARA